jgi:aspartate-semialdehyde dehydrogenase
MAFKVAVVGATGAVGREILDILYQRAFPISEIWALASGRSAGKTVKFGVQELPIYDLEQFSFAGLVDIALFSAGGSISEQHAIRATKVGAVVIDNTSYFRMDPAVPLVVPEVNASAIAEYTNKNIIANPNCSTAQMVVALKPLHDLAKIKRVVVSTYQSVSGAGSKAMEETENQTHMLIHGKPPVGYSRFTKQIAFNVIPHIDNFMADGFTREEWKMAVETKKILDPNIEVVATCVRVPVMVGHAEVVNIEFENPITVQEARDALSRAYGIRVVDSHMDGGYMTPQEATGTDAVHIGRIRKDTTVPHGLIMWIVADNLRKGAALNAVQIAEILARDYLGKV